MAQLVHHLKRSHVFYHSSDKWYNNVVGFFNISGPSLGLFLCPFLYALPFVYFLKNGTILRQTSLATVPRWFGGSLGNRLYFADSKNF